MHKSFISMICQLPDAMQKELVPMVTYQDLIQFVIMLCSVITLVVTLIKRK